MNNDLSILVLGEQSSCLSALAERARRMGHRAIRAKTPADAANLAEERNFCFAVALIGPDLPVVDLGEALEQIRSCSRSERLTPIAVGAPPLEAEERERLRRAGVQFALWDPVGDHALRFQLNRALCGAPPVTRERGQERFPTGWGARVFVGGHEKNASVYSISGSGSFLETRRPSQAGVQLAVELDIPEGPVQVAATVVYTNVPGNLRQTYLPDGMAIRFTDQAGEACRAILESLARSATRFLV
jgi:CheY-like chemotaxis protein